MFERLILSTSYTKRALLSASLALSLAGCGLAPSENARPLSADTPDPQYALTVALSADDTLSSVEAAHGGKVLVWEPGAFAVVGVNEAVEGALETNTNTFLSGGKRAEMNGSSRFWSNGSSRFWSNGEFSWMPENTALWQQVRLEEGHALASNLGYGVKVAIIDTGVDLKHPALAEALAPEKEWWDFYGDDAVPQEEGVFGEGGYGHGTNVAGIVRQVAPRATILPIRVLGPDGSGNLTDVASAIHWAVKMKADVINLSLGSDEEIRAVEEVIDAAAKKGVLVVASTGNTGDTAVTYPARSAAAASSAAYRLSVTSVDAADVKSTFATYRAEVELAAPGEKVHSPAPGERVAAWSGTSMAAPMASGALALALGEKLTVHRKGLTGALQAQSFDLYALAPNRAYAAQLGEGRLDLAAFLEGVVKKKGDKKEKGEKEAFSCEGGVTHLTLRYLGAESAAVRAVQKDGKAVLFEGEVAPGATFSFAGKKVEGAAGADEVMGKEVALYENGKKRGKLRTDCKKPLPSSVKMFEVVSGESLGGPLTPLSSR